MIINTSTLVFTIGVIIAMNKISYIKRTAHSGHKIDLHKSVKEFEKNEAFRRLIERYGVEKSLDKLHMDARFDGDQLVLVPIGNDFSSGDVA